MSYKNLTIFYFSGTGNAKFISEEIEKSAKEKGLNTELINIADKSSVIPEIRDDTIVGFCSPTHGFNMPPIMLRFIRKFSKNSKKNVGVFVLNTRAGMKFLKLFTPGLSGIALILPALLLRLKGFKIIGYRPMDMPSNWISIHPGIRLQVVQSIADRCAKIARNFTDKLTDGKRVYRGLISLPIDLAIIPISLGYYFVGRFMLAKTFIATDKCNQCGLCIKQCPVNAIQEIKGVNYWAFKCESCMKCMNSCPERAIETAHGFTFLIWWLITSVFTSSLTEYLLQLHYVQNHKSPVSESLIYNIVSFGVAFLTVFLCYKLLNFLMRFTFFNRIVAYTSLTKLRFWRRYKFSRKNLPTS